MIDEGGKRGKTVAEKRQLFMEMRAQNFDVIRLSTYRTACKLRFIQKRCNLHLVDVWNMIEAFRDNGLNTLDHNAEINVSRLETIISSIYFQLNKRLPTTHQINVEQSISLLLNFMIASYDSCGLLNVCFRKKIVLNVFLDALMADPPPQCLVWLPLMHRLANVENGTDANSATITNSARTVFGVVMPAAPTATNTR
ncbi:UNVERIFIED_CONTAM: hypothetical protein FKN15_064177 [Acipenser sinensis]